MLGFLDILLAPKMCDDLASVKDKDISCLKSM